MELQKHNRELGSRIRLLDPEADSQLAREFFELHEKKCRECQDDRLSCTVRPACKDRNFLNMLIELGVDPQDLPKFCYEQYLVQVRRHILENKGRRMYDRRLPIKDLLEALRMSSIRRFTSRFRKIWTKMVSIRRGDIILLAGDNLTFHFDFARGIVTLNPVHEEITSFNLFSLYVEMFGKFYDITAEARDFTDNWWAVVIGLEGVKTARLRKSLNEQISERFEALYVVNVDGSTEIQAEVVLDETNAPVEVIDIRSLFETASKAKQAAESA